MQWSRGYRRSMTMRTFLRPNGEKHNGSGFAMKSVAKSALSSFAVRNLIQSPSYFLLRALRLFHTNAWSYCLHSYHSRHAGINCIVFRIFHSVRRRPVSYLLFELRTLRCMRSRQRSDFKGYSRYLRNVHTFNRTFCALHHVPYYELVVPQLFMLTPS